jgi:creatinine amidohydrolase/Fe(II)-dependent formamide hydrolase-like protein
MREVRIQMMLPQDIRREMDRLNLLYIPIAPLEFHGPHLPYGTDPLNAYALALKAAQELGGLVHPTVYLGTEVPLIAGVRVHPTVYLGTEVPLIAGVRFLPASVAVRSAG